MYGHAFFQDSETPKVTLHSACGLSQLGFNEGLGVAPWNFSGPQWIACIIFIGGFVLRKYLLPWITDGLYDDLTEAKKREGEQLHARNPWNNSGVCALLVLGIL